jgi:hypothetical protein
MIHLPQHPVLKNPQSTFLLQSVRPSFVIKNTTGKITVLCILIFRFFDMRWEEKDFGLNNSNHSPVYLLTSENIIKN